MKSSLLYLTLLLTVQVGIAQSHIIIAPAAFSEQAETLALFYQNEYGIEREVVYQEDIFDEYGEDDPLSIRLFLQDTLTEPEEWENSSVLLLGSGTNDWSLDIPKNRIISFNNRDDNFVMLDDDNYPDVPIGRIPASTQTELNLYLQRFQNYMQNENSGLWQEKILFTADDEMKGGQTEGHDVTGLNHTYLTELFYEEMNKAYNFDKIYGIQYEFDAFGYKPEAKEDIISAINSGVAIWTYTGHGNNEILGDEHYFLLDEIELLENATMLPVFITASSNTGNDFEPDMDCLGARLLFHEEGGTIASIAQTRPSSGGSNMLLIRHLLHTLSHTNMNLGKALFLAKIESTANILNSRNTVLFGDPLLRNPLPVNENSVQLPENELVLGETIEISANVEAISNGTVQIRLYEAETEILYTNEPYSVTYFLQGNEIGNWQTMLNDSYFTTNIEIPQTALTGENAKIVCFIQNESNETVLSYAYPLTILAENSNNEEDVLVQPIPTLHQNFPNPFNPSTTIRFSIPEAAKVSLTIFNIKGQRVANLIDEHLNSGNHEVVWHGKDEQNNNLSSGIYLYQLVVNGKIEATKKCIMMK